jgi:phosphomannomutase
MPRANLKRFSHIFRSYDIRGIYGKDLNEGTMERIGNSLTKIARENIVVAMDMRLSGKALKRAFVSGVKKAGKDILDLGLVPMGAALFYTLKKNKVLAYITASHLPKEWNGVKFFHPSGDGFVEEENFMVRDEFLKGKIIKGKREGEVFHLENKDVIEDYKRHLLSGVQAKKKIRVVLDCGNGMASMMVKDLFDKAGFTAVALFDEMDGTFPNRNPEPGEDPLTKLKQAAEKADLGIAYDGDGDRMVIIDDKGRKLTPEQVSFLLLSELLKKEAGPIIANVECSRVLDDIAKQFSRNVIRIRVGHPYIVSEAHRNEASFGVESSGHYVIPSLVPYDDSMAVSLYAACTLSSKNEKLSEIVDKIKTYPFDRINFKCPDEKKFLIIRALKKHFLKKYKNVNTIDGIRIDFDKGWVLIRASNTEPVIRLTIEADNKKEFEKLKDEFSKLLLKKIK